MKIWMTAALFAIAMSTIVRAQDLSSLDITANTASTTAYVQLLITDPSGRQSGVQSAIGPNVQNIPGSSYFPESFDNEATGESGTQIIRFGMTPVAPGSYVVTLFGLADRSYSMDIGGNDSSGNQINLSATVFTGFLTAGSSQEFNLPLNLTPGAKNTITKTVTFSLLMQEVQAASLLDQIGDKKFVESLEDLLTRGQKALERKGKDADHHHDGDNDQGKREAVEILRQFISQVDSATKEKPDQDRDRDDKQFATSSAAQSLTSDAKTLIQQLEGQPGKDHDHHDRDKEGH